MSKIDSMDLRRAFGSFLSGVTVVTTRSDDDTPLGFTANSFTSVSLDPPLLLVCPARSLSCFEIFRDCEHFAINILAEDQQDISNIFASSHDDRFAQIDWHDDQFDCPLIDRSTATFSCVKEQSVDAGDHVILIGRIEGYQKSDYTGLGYANGAYFSLERERRAAELPQSAEQVTIGAIVEWNNQILLIKEADVWHPPRVEARQWSGALATIRQHLKEHGLEVIFGPVYSVYENKRSGQNTAWYRGQADSGEHNITGAEFVSIEQLEDLDYSSDAISTMMKRYLLERRQGVFQFYLGDEHSGHISYLEEK